MKKIFGLLALCLLVFWACEKQAKDKTSFKVPKWSSKAVIVPVQDSLIYGKSYLPVYSQVYSISEQRTLNLTVMVSLRNMSETHSVYLTKANYYDSTGNLIRAYLDNPAALKPLETGEIVINEDDSSGGTGGNFIFEWQIDKEGTAPLFQAVMNSTLGQQGLSFITEGKRID